MQKIMVFLIAAMLFTIYFLPDSFASISIKKSDEIRCTTIHSKFLKMGEDEFRKRYSSYPIMDKCMMLYGDPDFIKKHTSITNTSSTSTISSDAKILSTLKIGHDKFLIKFNMCYDENKKTKYVLIITDKEQVVGKDYRLHKEACPSSWIMVKAHDPLKTQFSWDYEHKSYPKIERKML